MVGAPPQGSRARWPTLPPPRGSRSSAGPESAAAARHGAGARSPQLPDLHLPVTRHDHVRTAGDGSAALRRNGGGGGKKWALGGAVGVFLFALFSQQHGDGARRKWKCPKSWKRREMGTGFPPAPRPSELRTGSVNHGVAQSRRYEPSREGRPSRCHGLSPPPLIAAPPSNPYFF